MVDARGLAGDRRFMLVDANGLFLSQRTHPRMAMLGVGVVPGELRVTAPDMPELTVPARLTDGPSLQVRVWDDVVSAIAAPATMSEWFGRFLGVRCSLVFMPDSAERRVKASHGGAAVSFADAFPFLLVSRASLAELNTRLAVPLSMDRFRPNLVVGGCPAYAEDSWRSLSIGPVRFRVAKPCARCSITTVDQATGERGAEPLATLATYRREGGKVLFGQNLVHETLGLLRVGNVVDVEPPD